MLQLWDRIRDWVVMFALLGTAVFVMALQNEPLVRSVRAISLEITAQLEARFAWVGTYVRALEQNDALRQKNIQLAGEVARSREAVLENERLKSLLLFRDSSDVPLLPTQILSKDIMPARVLAKDITPQQNLLTLNVGSTEGVEVGMGVVDTEGIIGKVVLVSPHYSRVMPYLNTEFRVPGTIQPLGADGIVRWEGEDLDRLLMEHIVKTDPVAKGQRVVTSGYSGVFPAGYLIGTVDTVMTRPGRNELMVYLRPAAPITHVDYVFVILQLPSSEQTDLEAQPIR